MQRQYSCGTGPFVVVYDGCTPGVDPDYPASPPSTDGERNETGMLVWVRVSVCFPLAAGAKPP